MRERWLWKLWLLNKCQKSCGLSANCGGQKTKSVEYQEFSMLPQNRRTAQMFIALWHSLETFIFVFCNLSKSPNDKKNTFVQWYPLVCKRIFPIVTNINSYQIFREVLYFSCSVHFCTFQLVFRTFFVSFLLFLSILQDFDYFCIF